jgi:hypothetical protein
MTSPGWPCRSLPIGAVPETVPSDDQRPVSDTPNRSRSPAAANDRPRKLGRVSRISSVVSAVPRVRQTWLGVPSASVARKKRWAGVGTTAAARVLGPRVVMRTVPAGVPSERTTSPVERKVYSSPFHTAVGPGELEPCGFSSSSRRVLTGTVPAGVPSVRQRASAVQKKPLSLSRPVGKIAPVFRKLPPVTTSCNGPVPAAVPSVRQSSE